MTSVFLFSFISAHCCSLYDRAIVLGMLFSIGFLHTDNDLELPKEKKFECDNHF